MTDHADPTPPPIPQPRTEPAKCGFCGYDLSNTNTPTCPECGNPARPRNTTPGTSGWAIASLVLGILSLVSCTAYGIPALIFGPLAIWFASQARKEVQAGAAAHNSLSLATAGKVCGIIGICLGVIVIAIAIIGFSAVIFANTP
jgi:ribosomal protein L37E